MDIAAVQILIEAYQNLDHDYLFLVQECLLEHFGIQGLGQLLQQHLDELYNLQ